MTKIELPVSVEEKIKWYVVVLDASSNAILREVHEDLGNTTKTETAKIASLPFEDESIAKRVAEAFKHAVALWRNTEPF